MSLNKAPTGPVVVRVTSNDVSEGLLRGGDSPTVAAQAIDLTFTPDDFLTPQTVTVVGQADSAADGNQTYTIGIGTPTGDASYASVAPQTIQVANADTDVAGYTVSAPPSRTRRACRQPRSPCASTSSRAPT